MPEWISIKQEKPINGSFLWKDENSGYEGFADVENGEFMGAYGMPDNLYSKRCITVYN
jgi:hypothetical protein